MINLIDALDPINDISIDHTKFEKNPSFFTKFCSFFNMFRAFVAVGIFAIPFGFKLIGPLLALFYTIISGGLVYYGKF